MSAGDAQRLAAVLPEWEEQIVAGTERLSLTAEDVARVGSSGLPLRIAGRAPNRPQFWPSCYHTLQETYDWVDQLDAQHPQFVKVYDFGDSHCKVEGGCRTPDDDLLAGHDLLALRITNELAPGPKLGPLWIDGGIHAREISATELMMLYVEHLIGAYGEDPQVTYLLDSREIYVGVNLNPDGRDLVELGDGRPYSGGPWYWRKNGHEIRGYECSWPPSVREHYGVDLNRNHSFKWQLPGHSNDPCAETYRGQSAASEVETQAIEAFWRTLFPDQRGEGDEDAAEPDTAGLVLSFHNATMPGLILVPYGHTSRPPPDFDDLDAIGARFIETLDYEKRRAIYATSGSARDWVYGELGVPAYVIELEGMDFLTPCQLLPGVIEQQLGPITAMAALADRPYERVNGPVVTRLTLPRSAHAGERLHVTAVVDESGAGSDAVAGAEIVIGMIGGESSGGPHPGLGVEHGMGMALRATDGAFDEVVEDATLELPTFGLKIGRHIVVARARDEHGHWGPPQAAFLDLEPALPASATPGDQVTPAATATLTATTEKTATATATTVATPTATPSPTSTSSPSPIATPTLSPTATATPSPTASATATLTPTSTSTWTEPPPPTPTATSAPTSTGTPTRRPPGLSLFVPLLETGRRR